MAQGVELATAYVSIVPTTSGIRAAIEREMGAPLDEAAKRSGKRAGELWSNELRLAGAAAAAGAGILGLSMARAASDTAEAWNKVQVVFGDSADGVRSFTDEAATSLGLSQRAALDYTGTLGNLLLSTGQSAEASAEMSTTLVQLAADLGSFNNVGTEEALEAIRAGLVGETEPLKKFGINLNDATLRQEALNQGIYDGAGVLSAAQKSQAAYAIILEQSTTAQGDFARTADGAANKAKILSAQLDDQKARIGEGLLPAYSGLLSAGTKVADVLGSLPPPVAAGSLAVAGLGGAALFLTPKVLEGARAVKELAGVASSGVTKMADLARGMDRGRIAAAGFATAGIGAVVVALNEFSAARTREISNQVDEVSVGIDDQVEKAKTLRAELIRAEQELAKDPFQDDGRELPLIGDIRPDFTGTRTRVKELSSDLREVEKQILDTGTAAEITAYRGAKGFRFFGAEAVERSLNAALERSKDELSDVGGAIDTTATAAARAASVFGQWQDQRDKSFSVAAAYRDQSSALEVYAEAQALASGRGKEWADASERIADAQSNVRDALRGVGDAVKAQTSAVQRLRDAERDALSTRRSLNDAYAEAQKRLEALRRTVAGDRLSVREAEMALAQAKEEAALAVDDPSTLSVDEREQAQIRLERAELALAEARARAAESAEELNDREQAGLDQSPEVIAAKEAIEAADRAVIDAQDALVEAGYRVEESHARVAEAEAGVQEAMRERQRIQDEAIAKLPEYADAAAESVAIVAEAVAILTGNVQGGIDYLLEQLERLDPSSPMFQRVQDMIASLQASNYGPGYYGAQGVSYNPDDPDSVVNRPRSKGGDIIYSTKVYGVGEQKLDRNWRRMGPGSAPR